ncbi:MAG: hypothetical protein ACYDBQ_03845 [Thermoplasmatota archaeon]
MNLLSWWGACTGLSALVAVGLATLLVTYSRNYRRARSPFSLGLVVFAGALMVEALGSIAVWTRLSGEYGADVAVPMMVLRGVEAVGVGVLAWVSFD